MFCTKCGSKLEPGARYCDSCWLAIEAKNYWQDVNWMKVLGYLWVIAINVIAVLIVIAIYDGIYDSFETIVVSLLIIIYCDLRAFSMNYGVLNSRFVFWLNDELKKIRVLLKEKPNDYEEAEMEKLRINTEKNMTKVFINGGSILLIFLIAIVNLLGAL